MPVLDYSEFLQVVQALRADRDYFKTGPLAVQLVHMSEAAISARANPLRVYLFNPIYHNDN